MATAEELLMTAIEDSTLEVLEIDLNTRVIAIPASLKILGVESDDDVKRLQFVIPQHYGEFDLSAFDFRINFKNKRGKGDVYPVDDLTVTDDDKLAFTWLVDRTAFTYAGDVEFSVCMKLFDNTGMVIKELNTTYASLPVLPGLETEKAVVEQNPSAFDQVMYRLYAVEAASGIGQNGYYTIVKVSENEDGVVFSFVNQDGTVEANIMHGHTPVRGVDYWTEEDVSDITADLKKRIDAMSPMIVPVTLVANDWVDGVQTVEITGIDADSMIFIAPHPEDTNETAYTNSGIRCVEQGDNQLTFRCTIIPSIDINVNVVVYHGSASTGSGSVTVFDDDNGNVTML